jgi:predicted nucleotidyltransferase
MVGRENFRVRDRDSPVTKEGLIFRVYGYQHPPKGCVCDVEYAPEEIYRTDDPRSIRKSSSGNYYKFFVDGGLRFVAKNYPQYQLNYEPLQRRLVGLTSDQITELRKPEEKLVSLLERSQIHGDKLLHSLQDVLDILTEHSSLHVSDFGVFGSMLHDFYHVDFSDIDLVIYGRKATKILRDTLREIYRDRSLNLINEFDYWTEWAEGRHWFFRDISLKEFCERSKQKMIYSIYKPPNVGRDFKVEFEPVRGWSEIKKEYDSGARIRSVGWVRAIAEILDDSDSFFIPSIYTIEVIKLISGPHYGPIEKINSFVEEFRGQADVGEKVLVEGNLEEVNDARGRTYQVTLTRVPNYYKQVLKSVSSSDFH